jgi:hypothetical protein
LTATGFYHKLFPRAFVIIILGRVTWSYDFYYKASSFANNIESRSYRSLLIYIYYPDFSIVLGLDFLAKIIYIIHGIYLVFAYIDLGKISVFVTEITSVSITIIYKSHNNQVLIYLIKRFIIS